MLKKLKTWIFRKKVKAVIFDYDGVLNDSLPIIRKLYNEFYERGITNLYFKDDPAFTDFFQGDMWKNMENAGMKITKENKDLCNSVVKEVLAVEDPKVKLFEGIDGLLLNLKDDGYKIGIASNGNREIIISKLKDYKIDHVVSSVIGYEQVRNPKPDPEGLLKCLYELKVQSEKAMYVGDMESDIEAAKAAGVKVIMVTYGYLKLKKDLDKRLKDADYIAHDAEDIGIIVRYFSKKGFG